MSQTAFLTYLIAQLDQRLDAQLAVILQAEPFQRLKAAWVGLHYLATQASACTGVKVKFLNASWMVLCKDVCRAGDVEQSALFDKVYHQELGMAGGEPFGLLLGDYRLELGVTSSDRVLHLQALKMLSEIAMASFAVFVTGFQPSFLGLDDFRELSHPLPSLVALKEPAEVGWKTFRESESARFVGLILPKVRLDSHAKRYLSRQSQYCSQELPLWANAIYAYGAVFLQRFAATGWFMESVGFPNEALSEPGGLLVDLEGAELEETGVYQLLTETVITSSQEQQLNQAGLTVISHLPHTPYAAIVNNPSLKLPVFSEKSVLTGEELACAIPYLLSVCRFAHYLKAIGREQLGHYQDPKACQRFLQDWLNQYVASNDELTPEMKARFPLTAGEVTIMRPPGYRELYHCLMRLSPQLRVNQITAGVVLKTTLLSPTV